MANEGQIGIELKVFLSQMNIKAVSDQLKASLGNVPFLGANDPLKASAGVSSIADSMNKVAEGAKKATEGIKNVARASASAMGKGHVPGSGVPYYTPADEIVQAQGLRQSQAMGQLFPSYSGPTPPKIGPQQDSIASMVSNFFNKGLTGPQSMLVKLTAGLAAFRVGIGLLSYAINMALIPIRAMMQMFLHAAEDARRLYASALQSGGLPVGFVAKRNALADILGVGAEDVWQYSQAIAMLNEDIKFSTSVIRQTNPTLTAMGWEWKILQQDMKAMWAQIAYDMTPAIHVFFNTMHAGITSLTWVAKQFAYLSQFQLVRLGLKMFGQGASEAPPPTASASRLASSMFEKQGLVLGLTGGGNSPMAQTAKNTAKTASLLERMLDVLGTPPAQMPFKYFGAQVP